MSPLTVTISPTLQVSLNAFMRQRGLQSPTEAIEVAVLEGISKKVAAGDALDYRSLIGLAGGTAENPAPRFKNDDALWETDRP